MKDRCHKLSKALTEFTTFVIGKYDIPHQSAKNQILVKGVFSGDSCESLVDYAKDMRSFAYEDMSIVEIAEIEKRSCNGKNAQIRE